MNSMTCRRPDIVCSLEFTSKFNVVVSFQNFDNTYIFLHVSNFFLNNFSSKLSHLPPIFGNPSHFIDVSESPHIAHFGKDLYPLHKHVCTFMEIKRYILLW